MVILGLKYSLISFLSFFLKLNLMLLEPTIDVAHTFVIMQGRHVLTVISFISEDISFGYVWHFVVAIVRAKSPNISRLKSFQVAVYVNVLTKIRLIILVILGWASAVRPWFFTLCWIIVLMSLELLISIAGYLLNITLVAWFELV